MTFEQAIAYETQAQGVLLSSADAAEALEAFRAERDPHFEGAEAELRASGHAELVALGVLHHDPPTGGLVEPVDLGGAGTGQLGGERLDPAVAFLGLQLPAAGDMDVEMQPVLRPLAFRDLLEEDAGPSSSGSTTASIASH